MNLRRFALLLAAVFSANPSLGAERTDGMKITVNGWLPGNVPQASQAKCGTAVIRGLNKVKPELLSFLDGNFLDVRINLWLRSNSVIFSSSVLFSSSVGSAESGSGSEKSVGTILTVRADAESCEVGGQVEQDVSNEATKYLMERKKAADAREAEARILPDANAALGEAVAELRTRLNSPSNDKASAISDELIAGHDYDDVDGQCVPIDSAPIRAE